MLHGDMMLTVTYSVIRTKIIYLFRVDIQE
jgi:hypothetical protein